MAICKHSIQAEQRGLTLASEKGSRESTSSSSASPPSVIICKQEQRGREGHGERQGTYNILRHAAASEGRVVLQDVSKVFLEQEKEIHASQSAMR